MSRPARRAAVLGHPIAHSLSPVLHRAAYAALGLEGWTYEAIDTPQSALSATLARLDQGWAGLSLTMPLKQAVIPLLDHVEPLAEVVGVVNTVLVHGSAPALVGANTDVHGLVRALREGLGDRIPGPAVVLGAGATAASALAALAELGQPRAEVLVRSMGRAGLTMRAAHRMGVDPRVGVMGPPARVAETLAQAGVVVSTLPPHAADEIAAALDEVVGSLRLDGVLLDCAYDPRPTALAAAWARAGGVVVGGERMLLHQATEQVRLMTGEPAPIEAMDAALTAVLAERDDPRHGSP
ncbi:shikimate dehydrogenase [Actinotalea sp.]|uniref:shikimate dehydrogenase n=1 Tax=Actinotalea sp. TaxID=1872145 RepID=UPI0035612FB9